MWHSKKSSSDPCLVPPNSLWNKEVIKFPTGANTMRFQTLQFYTRKFTPKMTESNLEWFNQSTTFQCGSPSEVYPKSNSGAQSKKTNQFPQWSNSTMTAKILKLPLKVNSPPGYRRTRPCYFSLHLNTREEKLRLIRFSRVRKSGSLTYLFWHKTKSEN